MITYLTSREIIRISSWSCTYLFVFLISAVKKVAAVFFVCLMVNERKTLNYRIHVNDCDQVGYILFIPQGTVYNNLGPAV